MVTIQTVYIVGGAFLFVFIAFIISMIVFHKKKTPEDQPVDKMRAQKLKLENELKDLENKEKTARMLKKLEDEVKKGKAKQISVKHTIDKKAKVIEADTKTQPYNFMLTGRKKTKLKFWIDRFKERLFPHKTVLVTMELMNGFFIEFLVTEKDGGFRYRGRKYVFDNESKYYKINSKLWCFDYHENFTLPIKRKIPVTEIKKTLEQSNITEVEYATNPSTLERFIVARIAEGIMKGQQLDEFLKQIRLILIIAMVASVSHLILFMFKSGMLSSVKIPGVT